MRFSWNTKCKIWSRACRIDSWQKQLCIFITRMSILIFVRVLENSSQRAYFRSCDENTPTPLADKREIGGFMGFPVPYWKIWLVCWNVHHVIISQVKRTELLISYLMFKMNSSGWSKISMSSKAFTIRNTMFRVSCSLCLEYIFNEVLLELPLRFTSNFLLRIFPDRRM